MWIVCSVINNDMHTLECRLNLHIGGNICCVKDELNAVSEEYDNCCANHEEVDMKTMNPNSVETLVPNPSRCCDMDSKQGACSQTCSLRSQDEPIAHSIIHNQEKNRNVQSVHLHFVGQLIWKVMLKGTANRNHLNVTFVHLHSLKIAIWENIL